MEEEKTNNRILIICSEDGYKRKLFAEILELKTKSKVQIISGFENPKDRINQFYLPSDFNPLSYLKSMISLSKYISIYNPDLLNVFDTRSSIVVSLLKYFQVLKMKTIRTQNGLGIFENNSNFLRRIPCGKLIKKCFNFFISYSFDYVIFQNQSNLDYCSNLNFLKLKNKKVIMGSGISENIIYIANQSNFEKNKEYFLYASRVQLNKGVLNFIKAAQLAKDIPSLVNYEWIIIGDYNDSSKNNKRIKKSIKQTENLHYLGYKENPYPYILNSKAIILPSSYGEGFPRIFLEAGMLRVPIITLESEYYNDVLFNDVNANLLKNGSPENIIKATKEIINNEYSRKITENFFNDVNSKYKLTKIVEKYCEVYQFYLKYL